MTRSRRGDRGRRRASKAGHKGRRDDEQQEFRQPDSRQPSDGRGRPRDGQGGQSRTAAAADSAARVATRHARTRPLRQLLEGIGAPDPAPFKPDPFQLEALAALEHEDVLVTAPTGSGKTWIAREEIRRLLGTGKRAWYTSPLKALTNSKYQEFIDE